MQSEARATSLLWPAVLTFVGLAILLSLGTWQMRRLAWKEALIARIETRAKQPPATMAEALAAWRQDDATAAEYLPVRVRGVFEPGVERRYYVGDAKLGPGAQVYSPLRYQSGAVVWVDRGFRPANKDASGNPIPGGEVEVAGVVRAAGGQGLFSPENDAKGNIWYWRDLAGMHASAYGSGSPQAAPFFIEARSVSGGPGAEWPKPGASPVAIQNRHLEYALTWYGLAATLLAVFMAYVYARYRRTTAESDGR
ncbi:MAG: SURF1 family protein [Hyphomicrobiaceae bacterium]